jgi:hypothetical protein
LLAATCVALALSLTTVAHARPRTPVLRKLTSVNSGLLRDVKLHRQRGDEIAFLFDGSIAGTDPAPAGLNLYLVDVESGAIRLAFPNGGADTQTPTRPTDRDDLGRWPRYVSFASSADIDPARDNSDGNQEIFLWETESGTIHQLTESLAPTQNSEPFASDTGECIVFTSTGDFDDNDGSDIGVPTPGFENADGSAEVFLFAIRSGAAFPNDAILTQISNGPAGTSSGNAVVGGYTEPRQCRSIGYRSDHDQLGIGRSGEHIYSYSKGSAVLEDMTTRKGLAGGPPDGVYNAPSISGASNFARGPFIVFTTSEDLWRNESQATNIYRYRFFHPELRQITSLPSGVAQDPVTSDGGGHIAFRSDSEVLVSSDGPHNADGNFEIFRIRGRRRVKQITQTTGCENGPPSMRSDSTRIAFWSNCDLVPTGTTPGQRQLFLYQEVEKNDPLASASACHIAAGCCNEANNCIRVEDGKLPRVPRRGCIDRKRGC